MAKPTLRRSGAARALLFALAASSLPALPAAAASSVVVIEPDAKAPGTGASEGRLSPSRCAGAFHARFAAIREGEFAALKAAAGAEAAPVDASLPGMLLFPPAGRPQPGGNAAALRTAADLAKARGGGAGPLDANARWIAARIREDLGDFLSQKETPFLCSGIDAYLDTLRAQGARIGQSPDRLGKLVIAQREAARASLLAARASLRTPPVPRFAPSDQPGNGLVADNLRSSVGVEPSSVQGPVMRVANRGNVLTSEGSSDPDLPAIKPYEKLAGAEDIARVVRDLEEEAEKAGALENPAMAHTDPTRTGGIAVYGPVRPDQRPALRILADLRPRLVGPTAAPAADPHARDELLRALSDLEALDYLIVAERQPAHPLPAALDATFGAIARAHAEACACKP